MTDIRTYDEQQDCAKAIDSVFRTSNEINKDSLIFDLKKNYSVSLLYIKSTIHQASKFFKFKYDEEKEIYYLIK